MNATGTNLAIGTGGAVPNAAALVPDGGRVRCVSMAMRVTYEGTELNRGGRYYAGLCPIQHPARTNPDTGVQLSALSTLCGTCNPYMGAMKMCMTNMVTARVLDGVFECRWFPNGVPTYQSASMQSAEWPPISTTTPTYPAPVSAWNTPYGGAGVQSGQNALVFMLENDVVASPAPTGNTYQIEVIWHWEVIPATPTFVAYDLTPSTSNYAALQTALNAVQLNVGGAMLEAEIGPQRSVPNAQQPKPQRRIMDSLGSGVRGLNEGWTQLPEPVRAAIRAAGAKAVRGAMGAALGTATRRVAGNGARRMIEL